MEEILQIIFVAIISSVKFVTAAPVALAYGLNYIQTLGITAVGGIVGVFFFFYLSQWLIAKISAYKNKLYFLFGVNAGEPKKRKVFNWRNRMIVKVVRNFGLIGIAAITPALLSIPLGTFIAARYFRNHRKVVAYLCVSVIFWAFVFSSVVAIF